MNHRATQSFWKLFDALNPEVQNLASKNFEIPKRDPKHPSLHFKRIHDDLWSVRVGIDFRALALASEDGFDWIWIGPHGVYDRIIVRHK